MDPPAGGSRARLLGSADHAPGDPFRPFLCCYFWRHMLAAVLTTRHAASVLAAGPRGCASRRPLWPGSGPGMPDTQWLVQLPDME